MVEVIHEHETQDTSGSGMGFLLGIIALILFLYMLFAFGLPALRRGTTTGSTTGNPQINVPSEGKLDVNVNQGGGQ